MQRVPVWKIILIVVVLLYSLWSLMPTYEFYSMDSYYRNLGKTPEQIELEEQLEQGQGNQIELQNRILQEQDAFDALRDDIIRLGMDLQGGVHLTMEIDRESFERQIEADDSKTEQDRQFARQMVLDSVSQVIENRVNQYGVAEAAIIKQPPDRIVLEMPGYSDPEQLKELVQADAQLSFHLVEPADRLGVLIEDINAMTAQDFQNLLVDQLPFPQAAAIAVKYPNEFQLVDEIIKRDVIQNLVPTGTILKWGEIKDPTQFYDYQHRYLFLLRAKPEITGANLENAGVYFDPTLNQPHVSLSFDRAGSMIFRRVTENNQGRHLAILMDDTVFSAPTINDPIRNGQAQITGIRNFDEARRIAVVLRAGALPAEMNIVESRVVGASLGQDSINRGIYAGLIGASIVLIFMIGYYMVCGVVADIAVIMSLVLLMAGMALFKATLTLPGIAGIILTVGMAVDANVLIFERLREELKSKRAKTNQLVLEKGYGRAFMTIFDANITTLITALVLFQFGTGPIKGFAVTLSLGIIVSMFCSIFVTRVILDLMDAYGMKKLNVGKLWWFENANYNFMSYFKPFIIASLAFGVIGFGYLAVTWDDHKGIDFSGGSELVVEFEQPTEVQTVRSAMSSEGYGNAVIQRILGEENQVLIRVAEGVVDSPDALFASLQNSMTGSNPILLQSNTVSAQVGAELLWKGFYCIIFASIGILLYITARFEFRFAVAAVAALFHDILFTLGLLAFTQTEFNLPIIAALLTVLGYSLNDTIIVFDRIRENYTSSILNFKDMVNLSINQTLSRTIITSSTTLMVLIVMYVVGGPVIHDFCFTLIVGILIGTYSSIFVASPLLLLLGEEKAVAKKAKEKTAPATT